MYQTLDYFKKKNYFEPCACAAPGVKVYWFARASSRRAGVGVKGAFAFDKSEFVSSGGGVGRRGAGFFFKKIFFVFICTRRY